LVVVELQPSIKVTRVAQLNDVDVVSFRWVDDERLIFSVGDQTLGSGEDYRSGGGLYTVKADGSETRTLINRVGGSSSDGVSRQGALGSDHLLLAVADATEGSVLRPGEIIVGRFNLAGSELRSVTPILQNIITGRIREMEVGEPPERSVEWFFDAKGTPRVVGSRLGDRIAYHRWVSDERRWVRLAETDGVDPTFTVHSVDADGTIRVLTPDAAQGWMTLANFDLQTGEPSEQALVRTPGFDFDGSLLRGKAGELLGIRTNTDAESTEWLNPQLRALQSRVDARWPGRVNRITCRRCTDDDMVALVYSYSDRDPGQIVVYFAKDQRWLPVSPVMPQIDPRQMATVDLKRFKARDGREIPVWLTLPRGVKPGHPAPAVVLVHGGPWVRGGRWGWSPYEQFLASRGYLVISPEFRGSTGYGREHFRAGWRQWGQAMQDDVADALIWAREQRLATDQACIAGASYGGYATLMGLVNNPELYRCGVSWVAVTDLPLLLGGSPWVADDASRDVRRFGLKRLVGDLQQDRAMIERHSPVHQAERITRPLLLAFGEQDLRVPLAHGVRMREALIKHGRPPQWVVYKGEAHSWRLPTTLVDFAGRMERFLAEHLEGGRVSR
jgi:dipeptidyl aminopeptidase/acylaminoacyl peptidase